ncbi:hypothetical protein [Runella slithyformis]|uniref:hypothetical protein n=1 Tax=Runella slithyformis TaxID=106 RepID=UPI00146D6295|nr:hypothetical protein [Runella slithyformis]
MKSYLLLLLFGFLLPSASVAQSPAAPKISRPDFIYCIDKAVIECIILSENSREISYRLLTDAPDKVRTIRCFAVERIERSQHASVVASPTATTNPSPMVTPRTSPAKVTWKSNTQVLLRRLNIPCRASLARMPLIPLGITQQQLNYLTAIFYETAPICIYRIVRCFDGYCSGNHQ